MQTLQDKVDAIREEFQDQRPDVVMVLDKLVEKLEGLEWQPIETAPKDEIRIIGLSEFGAEIVIFRPRKEDIYWWSSAGWWGCEQDSTVRPETIRNKIQHQPTHWMPVPNPKEGE